MIRYLGIVIGGLACAGQALSFDLASPLDCTLGEDCYIQQFFDRDAGPGWQDYRCGTLSYDGHDGTDFALPTRADMAAGVTILAAAAGSVKGMRDGIADFAPHQAGKECGNGVVIDHGDGWETQYCHMKQGSVLVKAGDMVDAGAPLGQVGQSGLAEFPHLHFSVRKNGIELDPFAPNSTESCNADPDLDLWAKTTDYSAGGILGAGFATDVPSFDAIKSGLNTPTLLPSVAPALVMWVYMFGGQKGDVILFDIIGPTGRVITERVTVERNRALFFHAVGRKLRGPTWPEGQYFGKADLLRRGEILDSTQITLTVSP